MKTSHVILGIGVVLATAGTIMYIRKRNADQEDEHENKSLNAIGRRVPRRKRGSITPKAAPMQRFECTDSEGNTEVLETNDYNEYDDFKSKCLWDGGTFTGTYTGSGPRRSTMLRRTLRATGKKCACGCN